MSKARLVSHDRRIASYPSVPPSDNHSPASPPPCEVDDHPDCRFPHSFINIAAEKADTAVDYKAARAGAHAQADFTSVHGLGELAAS